MNITALQLALATGASTERAARWHTPLMEAMAPYHILDAPRRAAMFLAQIGHESGRLIFVRELWGPTPAQRRYEGRADLGNTQPGDGLRFRGRGLIQVTGRANYAAARDRLREVWPDAPDFELNPPALEMPEWATRSAAEYWARNGCNELADANDFEGVTRRVNGGVNGLADREAIYRHGCIAVGC